MNSGKLHTYLSDVNKLGQANLKEIAELSVQFPYFQTAHLLYSITSKKADASLFQKSIKKSAIVAVNRTHLYELLYKSKSSESPEVIVAVDNTTGIEEIKAVEKVDLIAKADSQAQKPEVQKEEYKLEEIQEIQPMDKVVDLTEQVEKEMTRDFVEAIIEKKVLKTNEYNKKDEPETPKDASFGQWLSYLKKNNGQPLNEIEIVENKVEFKLDVNVGEGDVKEQINAQNEDELSIKKQQQKSIIDKIIESNPGSIKLTKDTKFFAADQKAKESLQENEHLVTETLAKIYALQGNVNKAIRAYQILSLKNPNKSAYFASQIEILKKDN